MNRKPGDWNCRSCNHLNFSRRDNCQRCGDPRSVSYGSGGGGGGGGGDVYGFGRNGGGGQSSFGFGTGSDVRPGDWYCSCGTHNFASRSNCFRCNALKEESSTGAPPFDSSDVPRSLTHPVRGGGFGLFGGGGGGARSGWKSGDWICTRSGCNEHNFASRMDCFRCSAPRESGTEV